MRFGLCLLIFAGLSAQTPPPSARDTGSGTEKATQGASKPNRELAYALTAHAAGSALDGWSSWGKMEANSLLRGADGRFGWRGVGIKAAIFGGQAAGSVLIARKSPRYRKAVIAASWVSTGIYLGVALGNQARQRKR